MAFRDDNDALRAQVARLQEELAEARDTISVLQGGDYDKPELLPKQKFGFRRRVRVIQGEVGTEVIEGIVRVLQSSAKVAMDVSLVGRILTAKSRGFDVTLMPGEGDELLLVFDEYPLTNYAPAAIVFTVAALASLGATLDTGLAIGLLVLFLGGLATAGAAYYSRRAAGTEQARRDELFLRVGGLLERNASRVRVASLSAEEAPELEADVAAELPETKSL